MQNKLKGFTIIELVVVVTIIGTLSAIVATNVISYIKKSKDASIEQMMGSLRTASLKYYEANSQYSVKTSCAGAPDPTGLFYTSVDFVRVTNQIYRVNGTGMASGCQTLTAWCLVTALNAGGYWCTDSTGYTGSVSGASNCTSLGACK